MESRRLRARSRRQHSSGNSRSHRFLAPAPASAVPPRLQPTARWARCNPAARKGPLRARGISPLGILFLRAGAVMARIQLVPVPAPLVTAEVLAAVRIPELPAQVRAARQPVAQRQ